MAKKVKLRNKNLSASLRAEEGAGDKAKQRGRDGRWKCPTGMMRPVLSDKEGSGERDLYDATIVIIICIIIIKSSSLLRRKE